MKKLHVQCLAFNTLDMVREVMELFEKQKPDYPITSKTLVDCRYPMTGDPVEHAHRLHDLAWRHDWNFVRPAKNYGVAGNWNWVLRELDLGDNDVLWGADPDGRPQEPKYLDAVMDVFNNAPECYTVQLNRPCVYSQGRPHFERTIGSTKILEYHELVAWSLGGFDCGWLRKIGGIKQGHPLYGYTEHATSGAMEPLGAKWYIAKDFYDVHLKSEDQKYTDWKLACAQQRTQSQFSDWLKSQ